MDELRLRLDGLERRDTPFLLAPFLQGVLMESIDTDYANSLHDFSINPYSQYVYQDGTQFIWRINTLNELAKEKIVDTLLDLNFSKFHLNAVNQDVQVREKSISSFGYDELMNIFNGRHDTSNRFTVRFITPTAFKQNGIYVFHPDLRLIIQSLALKYNSIVDNENEANGDLINEIANCSYITSYNVKSFYYPIEKIKIPGFIGTITFKVKGSLSLCSYIAMLLKFGEYSGCGIKTSMGMGAFMQVTKEAR